MQEDKDLSEKYQRRILTKYEYEHYFLKGKPLPPKSNEIIRVLNIYEYLKRQKKDFFIQV
ncbi:MAG: hypothetical protein ACTSSF_07760 [Candidatus Heimdallarchaeaceae archaeon]